MTVLTRGARPRRAGRRPGWVLLTVLLVLAIVASSALVFTNRVELLKLAVILALWAAVVAAFVSVIYRRQSDIDQAKARDLKLVYDLQLDREISARREYELTVESAAAPRAGLRDTRTGRRRGGRAAGRTGRAAGQPGDTLRRRPGHRPAIETERSTVRYGEWPAHQRPGHQQPDRHRRSRGPRRPHRGKPDHRRAGRTPSARGRMGAAEVGRCAPQALGDRAGAAASVIAWEEPPAGPPQPKPPPQPRRRSRTRAAKHHRGRATATGAPSLRRAPERRAVPPRRRRAAEHREACRRGASRRAGASRPGAAAQLPPRGSPAGRGGHGSPPQPTVSPRPRPARSARTRTGPPASMSGGGAPRTGHAVTACRPPPRPPLRAARCRRPGPATHAGRPTRRDLRHPPSPNRHRRSRRRRLSSAAMRQRRPADSRLPSCWRGCRPPRPAAAVAPPRRVR